MSCVTRIQFLRGTSAQRLAFTPLDGELVWDTDSKEMYVGDGTTLGGLPLSNLTNEQIQDIVGALIGDSSTIDVTYNDAGDVLTMDVITTALDHDDLMNSGTNTHAQIDAHLASTANPHTVTITQAINADGGTDITVTELETLTDGSEASSLHHHDSRYYTESEIDGQQLIQDNAIAQNASDISTEITNRTNADIVLQNQITSNDNDILTNANAIAQNASDLTDHENDTGNPHSVTFTQAVTADAGTDITAAEAETLTDTSDASSLHNHDTQYKKAYWQGGQAADQTAIAAAGANMTIVQRKNSDATIFVLATNELTISKTADFKFEIEVSGDTETGARETLVAKLQRDTGGGFVDLPLTEGKSYGYSYHRNNASGEDTNCITVIVSVTSGDKFRVVLACPTSATAPGVKTIALGTGIIVEEK